MEYVLLGELAAVLHEPADTLAQMLKRGGFTLPDADWRGGTGNWTKFSMADVATLAMIRALTGLGMQTKFASESVQYLVEKGGVELTDIDAFLARWRESRLVVCRRARAWDLMIFKGKEELAYPPAYIALDVARIVGDAVKRARRLAARRGKRRA